MNPRNEWQRMVRAAESAEGSVHLATVVDVAGSSYRRPGARMLILPDGRHIGGISGGCLERDLCSSAPWLTREGPRVVSFDTREEAARANPRYNLGCSGVVHVLVERVTGTPACPLAPLRRVLADDEPRVLATVYHATGGDLPGVGTRMPAADLAARCDALSTCVDGVRAAGRPVCCELVTRAGSCRLLIERIDPPPPLWVFGAGEDARPLVAMAAELGWNVTVVDKRAERLAPERFPAATARLAADPRDAPSMLEAGPRTSAVIMTHDLSDDAELLPWLLGTDAGYVGVLGPKARAARLLRRLHEQKRLPDATTLDRVHTPVGLDLGAATPAEIALAVLAEIVAVRRGRPGGRLAHRQGPIHEPAAHLLIDVSPDMDARVLAPVSGR